MKYRITLLMLIFSICFLHNQAFSQHQDKLEKLSEKLELTEEQQSAMAALFKEQKEAFDALDEEASREEKMEIRESFKLKIAEILTEEQMAKWDKMNRHRSGPHKGKDRLGKGKFDREGKDKKRDRLTEEQRKQLLDARTEFDSQLSEDEKELIEELRAQLNTLKDARKESDKEDRTKEEWRAIKKEFKTIGKQLKDIAITHKEGIKEALKSVDGLEKRARDRGDKSRRGKGERSTGERDRGDKTRRGNRDKRDRENGDKTRRGKDESKGKRRAHHKHNKFGRFLLLDPNDKSSDLVKTNEIPEFNLSPNPANNQTTINYNVKSQGVVVIDIRNEQGQVIETLLNESKEIGTHKLILDISQYKGKTYFITVSDKQGTGTEQLMIMK